MSDLLRKAVIRLAHSNPELRADLLPLLKTADGKGEDEGRAPNQEEKSQIRDFISQPGIKDKDFHEWLGKKGINPHKAEDEVYAYVRELKTASLNRMGLLLQKAFLWALDQPDMSRGDAVNTILKREGLEPDALPRLSNQDLLSMLLASNDREMKRATNKPVNYWIDAIEAASQV